MCVKFELVYIKFDLVYMFLSVEKPIPRKQVFFYLCDMVQGGNTFHFLA